jgi:ABC-type transport system involved in cytochrome c biogenesis permease component
MQLLPIVQRELLVAARQRMTYLSRTLTAGVLLPIFALLENLHSNGRIPGGSQMLSILSTIVFVECMFAGIRYTSDSISEERREGTLGLLFLTDLKGADIVLGKVFARGLRAVFSLLAAFPILALTVLIGGVTGPQVVAICLTLLLRIVFSLSAGVFISSRGYRERNVLVGTFFFLLLISVVPVALNSVAIRVFGFYGLIDTILLLSPYHAFSEAGRGFGRALPSSLWMLFFLSAAFLIYAAWRVRRTFGETESPPPPKAKRGAFSPRAPHIAFRGNPLGWLARRGRIRASRAVVFAAFSFAFGLFCRLAVSEHWNWAIPVVFFGSYALHAIYKFLLTAESCRQLNEDRHSGSLELLLATPASTKEIVSAQLFATWRAWLPAMAGLAIMNWLWLSDRSFHGDEVDEVIAVLLPTSIILLVADTIVLPYRSVVRALYGERYTMTVFKTFVRTIGPPFALIAFMLAMSIGWNNSRESAVARCFIGWTVICVVYSCVLVADARWRLKNHFRTMAAGDPVPNRWKARVKTLKDPVDLCARLVGRWV